MRAVRAPGTDSFRASRVVAEPRRVLSSVRRGHMIRRVFCVRSSAWRRCHRWSTDRGQTGGGPDFVSAAELKQAIADARPWPPDPSVKYKRFGARDGYSYWVVQRDATGEVEQHDGWTDIFVVQSGEATLLTGGQIKGGKQTSAGRDARRRDRGRPTPASWTRRHHIVPAGTPHQFVVESGRAIFYVTIKTARRR